jgi:hypothetical protein
VATDGERYFVSGNTSLYFYSKSGELLARNEAVIKRRGVLSRLP